MSELKIGETYRIEDIGKASGNVDVFIWSDGEYDSYRVQFVMIETHQAEGFFKDFNPSGVNPIAYFHIRGNVRVPVPVEHVTRLSI